MCKLLKSKVAKRMATAKTIGFIFGLLGFFLMPYFFVEADMYFRVAMLLWLTTLWGLVWLFGYMDRHPVFVNWKFPFWFRWIFIWVWMNFMLVLFIYSDLVTMMNGTSFEWWSPYWIMVDWAFIWLIADYFATKFGWEGKELCE